MATSKIKFIDNSAAAKKAIQQGALTNVIKACELIRSQAKELAPVNYGHLRDNIDYKIEVSGKRIVGHIGSPDEYAIYNEYGTGDYAENGNGRKGGWGYTDEEGVEHFTHGQKPRPFLRPAFRANKANIKKILARKAKSK